MAGIYLCCNSQKIVPLVVKGPLSHLCTLAVDRNFSTDPHWHTGTLAHWHNGHTGTLAHWHNGTMAHWSDWHNGTLAHCWQDLPKVRGGSPLC